MNMPQRPALKFILEAALLVAGKAMSLSQMDALFEDDREAPDRKALRAALAELEIDYAERGIELVEVAGGFRLQSREQVEPWVGKLFKERTPRYSRALLETLVLIAYRQPITRGEIEEVRGVAVSSSIIKTLQEREWVKVIGHKEVPGRPALLGTTKQFLDYFNLKRLDDLPPLGEIKDLDALDSVLAQQLGIVTPEMQGDAANDAGSSENAENSENSENAENGERVDGTGSVVVVVEQAGESVSEPVSDIPMAPAVEMIPGSDMAALNAEQNPVDAVDAVDAVGAVGAVDAVGAVGTADAADTADAVSAVEPAEDPEDQLKRVIANFASEHQQELQLQREQEERQFSRTLSISDSADAEASPERPDSDDLSQGMRADSASIVDRAADADGDGSADSDGDVPRPHTGPPFSGDPPDSTDTLH